MTKDRLAFLPDDVDLSYSPMRSALAGETYVLGAFNPGMTRLPNGNLLLMVRVAEALKEPVRGASICAVRWSRDGFQIDRHDLASVNRSDPRQFWLTSHHYKTLALTSFSWLLPVEYAADGSRVLHIHYDRIISAARSFQEYGVEDARISRIGDRWYMTTCSVSAERHSTTLHVSGNGLDYELVGIIADHQNKDMLLFEGHVGGRFAALTRPLGELYFAYPPASAFLPGPSIQLAFSPDALHWKPSDEPCIRLRRDNRSNMKIGGGTPPVLTDRGWLTLYHGVEIQGAVGIYRTFWALLDRDDPSRIVHLADESPVLEADPELVRPIEHQLYVRDIVFSCGISDDGDAYWIASGECDLACRLTRISKEVFR